MDSEKTLKDVSSRLLGLVKKADPKAEALVQAYASHHAHIRFARNTVTTTGDIEQTSVTLALKLGMRTAASVTNQTDPAALQRLVDRTLAMARLSPEDPEAMPVLGPQKYVKTPMSDPAIDSLDPAARANAVRAALDAGKEAKLEVAGFLQHITAGVLRATSAGLLAVQSASDLRFSVTARTADGSGSGWANGTSRRRGDVDFGAIARTACARAAASRSAIALEPGRYTVVLEPAATIALTDAAVWHLDRRSADEGRSAYAKAGGGTRAGEKMFSELVTLVSQPASAAAPQLPFDGEGLALEPRTWVEKGVVKELSCGRYWAKKSGAKPTGGYAGYELVPGTASRDELIKGVKRGVLITRFWYTNMIDPKTLSLTGLTRDGTFLIEDGAVTKPVNNFRFNQSAIDALNKCDALSKETSGAQWTPDVRVPAMRTHEFLLASKSDAV